MRQIHAVLVFLATAVTFTVNAKEIMCPSEKDIVVDHSNTPPHRVGLFMATVDGVTWLEPEGAERNSFSNTAAATKTFIKAVGQDMQPDGTFHKFSCNYKFSFANIEYDFSLERKTDDLKYARNEAYKIKTYANNFNKISCPSEKDIVVDHNNNLPHRVGLFMATAHGVTWLEPEGAPRNSFSNTAAATKTFTSFSAQDMQPDGTFHKLSCNYKFSFSNTVYDFSLERRMDDLKYTRNEAYKINAYADNPTCEAPVADDIKAVFNNGLVTIKFTSTRTSSTSMGLKDFEGNIMGNIQAFGNGTSFIKNDLVKDLKTDYYDYKVYNICENNEWSTLHCPIRVYRPSANGITKEPLICDPRAELPEIK